jgi:hypothetical protein
MDFAMDNLTSDEQILLAIAAIVATTATVFAGFLLSWGLNRQGQIRKFQVALSDLNRRHEKLEGDLEQLGKQADERKASRVSNTALKRKGRSLENQICSLNEESNELTEELYGLMDELNATSLGFFVTIAAWLVGVILPMWKIIQPERADRFMWVEINIENIFMALVLISFGYGIVLYRTMLPDLRLIPGRLKKRSQFRTRLFSFMIMRLIFSIGIFAVPFFLWLFRIGKIYTEIDCIASAMAIILLALLVLDLHKMWRDEKKI